MIPTPFTLTVCGATPVLDGDGEPVTDDFGNVVTEEAERPWAVHAIAPGAMAEPEQSNRDLSLVRYTVLAPKSADVPTEHDQVQVDDAWLDVVGRPDDWTRGPWGPGNAGVTVELGVANG